MTQLHDHDHDADQVDVDPVDHQESETTWPSWLNAATILLVFVIVAVIAWALSGIYKINTSEVAVVERLGKFAATETDGGLHWGWPWPVDIVHKIPINQTRVVTVDVFHQPRATVEQEKAAFAASFAQVPPREVMETIFNPYVITGDRAMLNVEIKVEYQITDPRAYLLSVSHGRAHNDPAVMAEREEIIRRISQHVIVNEIARSSIDFAINDKTKVSERMLASIKEEADTLKLGISVQRVNLTWLQWPDAVNNAFAQATAAVSQAKTNVANAQSEQDRMINAAKLGDSQKIISEADAYKKSVVENARGEAERFMHVYEQYKQSPETTVVNIYSDAMVIIMTNISRLVMVQPGQKANIILDPVEDKIPGVDIPANSRQPGASR